MTTSTIWMSLQVFKNHSNNDILHLNEHIYQSIRKIYAHKPSQCENI